MSGDWGGLKGIIEEANQIGLEERTRIIVACPNDGSVLQKHPITGMLNCPFGDYRVSGGTTIRQQ